MTFSFGGGAAGATPAPLGFGAASAPGAASTGFSFGGGGGGGGGFGSTSVAASAAATSQPSAFSFAAPAAAAAAAASKPPPFGSVAVGTATTSSTFNFGGGAGGTFGAPGSVGFGTPATGTGTGTATAFGTGGGGGIFGGVQNKPAPAAGLGLGLGLGLGAPGSSMFGQQPALGAHAAGSLVAAAPAAANPVEQLYNAVLHCSVFGDERDAILARWNMMQASWGSGKAVYSQTMPPIDLDEQNPLCRFKTIGYSALPSAKPEQGMVSAIIRRKESELAPQKDQIAAGISGIFGNRPNVKVAIDGVRGCGAATSEVLFHVQEFNQQSGQQRRVPSNEIHAFLMQPMSAQQLQKLGVESVSPKVSFSESQVKAYLEKPPKGIDPRLWKQAQLDNPDPKKLIPVPLIGFKALQQRIACQDQQTKTYQGRLDAIAEEIAELEKRHKDTLAKMRDAKRRQIALSHRILHVIVKQEMTRKTGFTIQPEEEKLGILLEALQSQMSAPTQFKGKLNELLSQVRLQSQTVALRGSGADGAGEKCQLDGFVLQDVREVLRQQQDGIQALMQVLKEDLGDLATVRQAMSSEKKSTNPF